MDVQLVTEKRGNMRLTVMVLLVALLGCEPKSPAQSATQPAQSLSQFQIYELSERCGKAAEADFKRDWGNGIQDTKTGQMMASYTNHYNSRRNKCFVLRTTNSYYLKGQSASGSRSIVLYDINESKEFGSYFARTENSVLGSPSDCNVEGKICTSTEEWEKLVKPFMED
jgi:hypothetical protein